MKAMILAAGMGTRLKPLTNMTPKALINVGGYTMLELAIRYLKRAGIQEIVINLHHHSEQIVQYLETQKNFGLQIYFSDESSVLLNTGGAIKHASEFLGGKEPFVLMAVDILTNLDLHEILAFHKLRKPLVTLAVKRRETSRSLLFNRQMRLVGWKNNQTGEVKGEYSLGGGAELGFSGIHIIEPAIFDFITEEGAFSIIDLYLRLMESHEIIGFRHDESRWLEFGRSEKLKQILDSEDFKFLIETI